MFNFKVAFINVNSLISLTKRHFLKNFIMNRGPDILLIAEHKLRPSHNFKIDGYTSFIQCRDNSGGGGTAILIKDNFRCIRIPISTGAIESCVVKVWNTTGSQIFFAALYCKPSADFRASDLQPLINLQSEGEVFIGGDLNAKHPSWGGAETDTRGRALANFLLDCPNFEIFSSDIPTRPNCRSGSFIDVFLRTPGLPLENDNRFAKAYDYESDHRSIEVVLILDELASREVRTFLNFDRMNINRFKGRIRDGLSNIPLPIDRNVSIQEIDTAVENLESVFRVAIDDSVPKLKARSLALGNLPPRILRFIRERKRICRILRRSNDPSRFASLRSDINNLDRIIEDSIRIFERERYQSFLEGIRVDNRTFSQVKAAAGLKSRDPINELKDVNGEPIYDDTVKAETLAEHMQEVLRPLDGPSDHLFVNSINRAIEGMNDRSPLENFSTTFPADGSSSDGSTRWEEAGFIRPSVIGSAIACRPSKKSSGLDKIPDIALKRAGSLIFGFLAVLFNHCLNLGYFPSAWKKAMVVPVLKKGAPPDQCGSYRPISMLSAFGKLLEYFILKRLRILVEDKRILKDCQFGFRAAHSTSHALAVFSSFVVKGFDRKCGSIAVTLDFAKAFDSVWHAGILYKLKQFGIDNQTCRLVASFLKGRSFKFKVGDSLSSEHPVLAGVPQGSLLGPMLYNIFISDIPEPPVGGLQLLYADDVVVAMSGPRASTVAARLNSHLEILQGYFIKWGLRLNVDKCTAIVFRGKSKVVFPNFRAFHPVLKIGGDTIKLADKIRYLGVIFCERMEFIRHIDFTLDRAKKVYFAYQSVLSHNGGLSKKIKLLLYKQVIRPIISYAFPVWFVISSSQMERLRRWERSILTYCLGMGHVVRPDGSFRRRSCRAIYDAADLERIDLFLMKGALRFLETAQTVDNELLRGSLNFHIDADTLAIRKHLPPVALLKLNEQNLLYNNDNNLVFYHRRFNTLNVTDTVYITTQ